MWIKKLFKRKRCVPVFKSYLIITTLHGEFTFWYDLPNKNKWRESWKDTLADIENATPNEFIEIKSKQASQFILRSEITSFRVEITND